MTCDCACSDPASGGGCCDLVETLAEGNSNGGLGISWSGGAGFEGSGVGGIYFFFPQGQINMSASNGFRFQVLAAAAGQAAFNIEAFAGDSDTSAGFVDYRGGNGSGVPGGYVLYIGGTSDVQGGQATVSGGPATGSGIGGTGEVLGGSGGETGGVAQLVAADGAGLAGVGGNARIRAGVGAAANGTLTFEVGGVTYTWPATDGAPGDALRTDGAGNLFWGP